MQRARAQTKKEVRGSIHRDFAGLFSIDKMYVTTHNPSFRVTPPCQRAATLRDCLRTSTYVLFPRNSQRAARLPKIRRPGGSIEPCEQPAGSLFQTPRKRAQTHRTSARVERSSRLRTYRETWLTALTSPRTPSSSSRVFFLGRDFAENRFYR
jgi:hypothetical protein